MKYDATGFASSYLLLIFTLPLTIYIFIGSFISKKNKKNFNCECSPCLIKKRSKSNTGLFLRKYIVFPVLLSFTSFLIYNVLTLKHQKLKGVFNPYQILGVSEDSSKKVIRRKFLKLSVLHDPDRFEDEKEKNDNEIVLQNISRAYNMIKTGKLIQREKYEEIIAIPLFLLENVKYSFMSILIYVCLFGVFLPMKMYYNYKNYSNYNKIGVSYDSMEIFYNQILKCNSKESCLRFILNMICDSTEFKNRKYKLIIDKTSLKSFIESSYAIPLRDLSKMSDSYSLLMIHLFRVPNIDYDLNDMEFTLTTTLKLIDGIQSLALSLGHLPIFLTSITFKKMIVQAVPDPSYSALQFPNVSFIDVFKYYHAADFKAEKSEKNEENSQVKDPHQEEAVVQRNNHKEVKESTQISSKEQPKEHNKYSPIINSIKFETVDQEKQCFKVIDSLPRKIIEIEKTFEAEKESICRLKMIIRDINYKSQIQEDETNNNYGVLIREDGDQDLTLKNNYGKYNVVPLHSPYLPFDEKLTWSLHTLLDNELSEQRFVFNGDFEYKEVVVDVNVAKENIMVDLVLICDGYFGCDVEKKVFISVK